MESENLKILVIGAGAIGGITAANMSRSGFQVEVVDVYPKLVEIINNRGLHITGIQGAFFERMAAFNRLTEVRGKKDIILIATKANVLPKVAQSIRPLLKKDAVIISLQNGLCEEYLGQMFGKKRIIGCTVGWGATVKEPGEVAMTSKGDFVIGKLSEQGVNHFNDVKEILSQTAPVHCTNNMYGHLYSKLIINSCITTLGAISGKTLGQMLSKRKLRHIFIHIIVEAVSVGKAAKISIEKYADKLNFYKMAGRNSWLASLKNHLLIRLVGFKYRRLRSSSLQSLQTGRKTEIDFLNGYITQKGKELHIQTPLNDFLIKLVKEIEAGARNISMKNFDIQFFDQYS